MGKLLVIGILGLKNKVLLEGIGVVVQGCTGWFDVSSSRNDVVLSCLELFIFWEVLRKKDRKVII